MGMNRIQGYFTFQNAATGAANGSVYIPTEGRNQIIIDLSGTASACNVVFEVITNSIGNWRPYLGVNMSVGGSANSATTLGQLWNLTLEGVLQFRVRVVSVTGGNITVTGTITD